MIVFSHISFDERMGRRNAMIDEWFLVSGEETETSSSASIEMVAPAKERSNALVCGGYA